MDIDAKSIKAEILAVNFVVSKVEWRWREKSYSSFLTRGDCRCSRGVG